MTKTLENARCAKPGCLPFAARAGPAGGKRDADEEEEVTKGQDYLIPRWNGLG